MIINEFILKNNELATKMKAFSEEIDRLEQLRDLLRRKADQECGLNPNLSLVISRKLRRAKDQFNMLNKAYDEASHIETEKNTTAFISELDTEIKEIQDVFINLRYENSDKWN